MPSYVRTELRPGGFAIVWLEREPVNLMDLTMWQQLMAALQDLEDNQVCTLPCSDSIICPLHGHKLQRYDEEYFASRQCVA